MADTSRARDRMVDVQIAGRGVRDWRVLEAMRSVPREAFVSERFQEFAYEDGPLPIDAGQTISQPYIVALMIESAEIQSQDRVLEIGSGSGYAAAVLSRIAKKVYGIERHAVLTEEARRRIRELGYSNVELRTGDGTCGWPEDTRFNAIIVSAGGPAAPDALKEQLAIGGRLIIPIGDCTGEQSLCKITRTAESTYEQENLGAVAFVPLVGAQGWTEGGTRSVTRHTRGLRGK
jgi:protein-L-isoaspartate(D-aspartate) O-methyltransferase